MTSACSFALNPDATSEMGASIACGVRELPLETKAVLIALTDQPAVPPDVIRAIVSEWTSGERLVIPEFQGRGGHPVLVDLCFREELLNLDSSGGLRSFLKGHQEQVRRLPVNSPFIARDMDTWDDYRALHQEVFGVPPANQESKVPVKPDTPKETALLTQLNPAPGHLMRCRFPPSLNNEAGGRKGEKMFLSNCKTYMAAVLLVLLGSSLALAQKSDGGPVEFSMRSIDGQTVTSESLRGEVVVLAFGASWLPLSRTQLQGIRKLADEYSSRGVVVYFVSTESEDSKSKNFASDEQLRGFAQKYGLKVTVLRDPDGADLQEAGHRSIALDSHS